MSESTPSGDKVKRPCVHGGPVVVVKEVHNSPLLGQRVRLRLEFEGGEVDAPIATIVKVYDASKYQKGTDQFCLVQYEPPATIRKPVKRSLFGPKAQETTVDRLFFRVLQGKLENIPRDAQGNVTRIRYRASLEQLLLDQEPKLREVKGYAGVPRNPRVYDQGEFDDDRDLMPFAGAIALRP